MRNKTVIGFLLVVATFMLGSTFLAPKNEVPFEWPEAQSSIPSHEYEVEQPREEIPETVLYEYYRPQDFAQSSASSSSDIPEPTWMTNTVRSKSSQSSSWKSSSSFSTTTTSSSSARSSLSSSSSSVSTVTNSARPRPRSNLTKENSTMK